MTPTLIRPPRSTSGTTRRTVYWNALRSGTLGLLDPWLPVAEALGEEALDLGAPGIGIAAGIRAGAVARIAAPAIARQPAIRHGGDRGAHGIRRRAVQTRVRVRNRAGERQQH